MKCAFALLLTQLLYAQERDFQTQSRLVLVPASVTDSKGRFVDGLQAADFIVLDNGKRQNAVVDTFSTGVAPIALVVAVQSSGISAPALVKIQKIGAMIQPLITGERGCAALVGFDEKVRWRQECTGDNDAIANAFNGLRPGEPTSAHMLDAVHQAIERLRARANVRRVILLISESRDRGSETELETAIIAAQSAGVTVYAVTYSAFKTAFTTRTQTPRSAKPQLPSREPESPPGREKYPVPTADNRLDILGGLGELIRLGKVNTTQVLTSRTGGAALSFARQKGLEEAIEKLGQELHQQYLLSFTPEITTAGFHHLEVRLVKRGDYQIRARPGYWSMQAAVTRP